MANTCGQDWNWAPEARVIQEQPTRARYHTFAVLEPVPPQQPATAAAVLIVQRDPLRLTLEYRVL
jgi:hypothetical protein